MLQHYVLGKRFDLCFLEHKLAMEFDEKGHKDINHDEEGREKYYKIRLFVNLLDLILLKNTSIFLLILVKHTITLVNQMKN